MSSSSSSNKKIGQKTGQKGGFVLGLIVGLLVGLAVALGVALYITKVPVPFVNKVPQRTAEQDAEETQRNKNWDPNAPLAGKAGAKAASGAVIMPPAAAVIAPVAAPVAAPAVVATPAPAPVAVAPASKPEKPAADKKTAASAAVAAADTYLYFVQAGAYTKPDDAEQQRAKLALQGFAAKVSEREQSGRTVFRVRLGPIDNRVEAESVQQRIEAAGIEANLVRVQR